MKSKLKFLKRDAAILIFSISVSFLLVAIITSAATTINQNVNTGGTLTVTGASTLNGDVTLGDAAADVVLSTGGFQASSTALVGGNATFYNTITVSGAKGLVLGSSATDITGSAGMIYYNSTSKVVKMHDGTSWFTVGTSTSGWSLSGTRLQPSDLTNYTTFGTTTPQGAAVLTVEATTTTAVPLVLVGRAAHTGNLLQITANGGSLGGGANLFVIDNLGRVSTNFSVNGFATTTAATGAIATEGALTVTGASTLTGTSTITTGTNIGGGYSAGGTGATINSLGRLEINGDLAVNGFATTTAADGNISTAGTLTVTGTSTLTTGAAIGGGYSQGGTGADINSLGAIWANGDIAVNGKATTTASSGAIATENGLTVKGTASSSVLIVGGDSVNGTMNGIVSGMCNIATSAAIAATSTIGVQCTANGIRVGDRVFVTATSSLPTSLAVVSASSTAANTIGLYIANINGGASVSTGVISLWFLGIR